jgi:hypothetical protein
MVLMVTDVFRDGVSEVERKEENKENGLMDYERMMRSRWGMKILCVIRVILINERYS